MVGLLQALMTHNNDVLCPAAGYGPLPDGNPPRPVIMTTINTPLKGSWSSLALVLIPAHIWRLHAHASIPLGPPDQDSHEKYSDSAI
jgi:hypothetical protein